MANLKRLPSGKGPTTFEKILADAQKSGILTKERTKESSNWLRETAKKTKSESSFLAREDNNRLRPQLQIGEMGFFFYDPKHKKTLPYYDSFPLIFKLETYPDGRFLGLNLHYLPYPLRAKLMDALWELAITKKNASESTKLKISYDLLNKAARFAEFKPCIKMYLNSHVRSKFIRIDSKEWDIALFLPVHKFEKSNATKVWSDSRQKIKGTK